MYDCLLQYYPGHQLRSASQALLSMPLPSEMKQMVITDHFLWWHHPFGMSFSLGHSTLL